MIKLITLGTKILIVIVASILFTSCGANVDWGNGIDGDGNVTTQTRNVENNFSKIDISRGLNVIIEQSNSYSVIVEADENLQDHITTKVENGTLYISSDENIDEAKAKNIRVKLPSLIALETSSGSSASSRSLLTGTEISVKTSSGSSSELTLEYDTINCKSSSGSTITVSGKALSLKTDSSSGSTIEAFGLLANDVIAESTSGSSINVHPLVSLNAKASSGSSIDYNSSPKTVVKEESSGGSISKE